MAIQETITVEIADVQVNDDYRVELTQLRKVMNYSPQQARGHASELIHQAEAAECAVDEDMDGRFECMRQVTLRMVTGEVVL